MGHMTNQQIGAFVAHCYTLKDISFVKVWKSDYQGGQPYAEIGFNLPTAAALVDSGKISSQLNDALNTFADMEPFPCPCGCGAFISVSPCLRQSGELTDGPQLDQSEKELIMQGNVIAAIREIRSRTGLNLQPAKSLADEWIANLNEPTWENFKIANMTKGNGITHYCPNHAKTDPYNRKKT